MILKSFIAMVVLVCVGHPIAIGIGVIQFICAVFAYDT